MKITITNHEHVTTLKAFTTMRGNNGSERAEIWKLADLVGVRDKLLEVHLVGEMNIYAKDYPEARISKFFNPGGIVFLNESQPELTPDLYQEMLPATRAGLLTA